MTQFYRNHFNYHGGYLTYGANRRFVARFKHGGKDKPGFLSFLIKNFTVEEYFAALEAGTPPVKVLETKGYVPATVRKLLQAYPEKAHLFPNYKPAA